MFSDQTVRRISPYGQVSDYYHSTGNWAPTQGVFDDEGHLWLMESSDKNEIRVIKASPTPVETSGYKMQSFLYIGLSTLVIA